MFYVWYDGFGGVLTYANAGHNLPFIYRMQDGRCDTIESEGMAMGVLPDTPFDQGRARLSSGDILVLYTDGVTEAKNEAGEQFGESRLHGVVVENNDMSAQALLDEVYRQVYRYSEAIPQYDDITLVVMKVTGGQKDQ